MTFDLMTTHTHTQEDDENENSKSKSQSSSSMLDDSDLQDIEIDGIDENL